MLLINNIFVNWLQSVHTKTNKNMPVFTCKKFLKDKKSLPYGFIVNRSNNFDENTVIDPDIDDKSPKSSQIELNLVVPQQDVIQYFTQWLRYRKYWWSSITTTPSLFTINEIKYEDKKTNANIVAQFPWGVNTVETISTNFENHGTSQLKCTLSLEHAMIILLLDGLNNTREDYLRLHRTMAPYKVSFAILPEETSVTIDLYGLAKLIHYRLKLKGISTHIPDFTLPLEKQIKENLLLGVTYTAILNENTLKNGIFHLLNSSTMLKEEIHVADFDSYTALICSRK